MHLKIQIINVYDYEIFNEDKELIWLLVSLFLIDVEDIWIHGRRKDRWSRGRAQPGCRCHNTSTVTSPLFVPPSSQRAASLYMEYRMGGPAKGGEGRRQQEEQLGSCSNGHCERL